MKARLRKIASSAAPDVPPSSRSAAWAVLPLRAFLGFTYCFASLQKLSNPAFFRATSDTSIQAQLRVARVHSPIGGLLGPAVDHAVALGVVIAFAELAVGVGTLLGLWSRLAALGGMLLSLSFFLTVSFHSSPYYYGADIVFLFAWTPLLVAGSGGVLSLGSAIEHRVQAYGAPARAEQARPASSASPPSAASSGTRGGPAGKTLGRRVLIAKGAATGAVALAALAVGGIAAAVGRAVSSGREETTPTLGGAAAGSPTTTAPSSRAGGPAPASSAPAATEPPGRPIGLAADVPVGGAARFTDPASGQPAYAVQPQAGDFAAFSAICTHAGCTVGFSRSDDLFVCPCHGSVYDAANGSVLQGPATRPLPRIAIEKGPDGQLYVKA